MRSALIPLCTVAFCAGCVMLSGLDKLDAQDSVEPLPSGEGQTPTKVTPVDPNETTPDLSGILDGGFLFDAASLFPDVNIPGLDAAAAQPFQACGGNGIDGDKDTLYASLGGQSQVVQACPRGCEWTPNHQRDRCRVKADCNYGEGYYCGNNGVSGDPAVLFLCRNEKISASERCTKFCEHMPPNVDDQCAK